jgi:hypothetical protein
MNKEIREILQITKELEQSSNFKLADEFTNSLIRIADVLTFKTPVVEPMTVPTGSLTTRSLTTPVKSQGFPAFMSSFYSDLVQNNEAVVPTKLEKSVEKAKKLSEERSLRAVKIYNLVKKPNNTYSDYIVNSSDTKLKELTKTISKYTADEIRHFLKYINNPNMIDDDEKIKASNIFLWAFKMHIINKIPQEMGLKLGISGYSRSGKKPGEKQDKKTDQKLNFKTKENKTLPRMPTLPTTTPERVEEKPEEEREEVRPKPLQMPTLEPTPGTSPMTAPLPLGTPVFPKEAPELLTPEIMTPITSPKRQTNKEEEEGASQGPMTWNEFLNFLNPNYTPGQTPGQTPTQTPDETLEPSKVNTGNPKPPFSTSSPTKKQDEQPKTRTVIPFDMKVPETGFATPGGISFMKSFR